MADDVAFARTSGAARSLVNRQIAFFGHAIFWALGCLLIAVLTGLLPALIVAIAWGIGLALHGFFAVAAPMMRSDLERRAMGSVPVTEEKTPRQSRSLETLSAAVAHEIRNPITAAKSLLQQIAEDPLSPDNAEYAQVAVGELDRVERSIVHLLRFAREEDLDVTEMRMDEVARSALDTLRDRAAKLGVALKTSLEDTGVMRGDAEKLRRVLTNLVGNALDALEEAKPPSPEIEIACGVNLAATEVWVSVRDDGPGIPADVLPRIFDPFFTSKTEGTGFGLALARKTIEAHGGTLEAKNRASGGAELVFVVPRGPSMRAAGETS